MAMREKGALLSDRAIIAHMRRGELFESVLKPNQIQPNSVDLTLSDTWRSIIPNDEICNKQVVNPQKKIKYLHGKMEPLTTYGGAPSPFGDKPVYCLGPGEFILFASQEILNIPNGVVAFVQGRSSIARIGVQTEQAGLIDAGFRGTITFEVYNETPYPIYLLQGMRVAQVYFFKAMQSARLYGKKLGSKYSNQIEATGSRIYMDPEVKG